MATNCKAGIGGGAGGGLPSPGGVAADGAGNVYVSDSGNARIEVFSSAGAFLRAWGQDVVTGGSTGFEVCTVAASCKAGAPGLTGFGGELTNPSGVAADAAGNVYVSDSGNNRIEKFSSAGAFQAAWGKDVVTGGSTGFEVCTVAASCKIGFPGGVLGGELNNPVAIAADAAGNTYVADVNSRVQKFNSAGAFQSAWGKDVDTALGMGYEVCTVAANCQMGIPAGQLGGEFLSRPPSPPTGPGTSMSPTRAATGSRSSTRRAPSRAPGARTSTPPSGWATRSAPSPPTARRAAPARSAASSTPSAASARTERGTSHHRVQQPPGPEVQLGGRLPERLGQERRHRRRNRLRGLHRRRQLPGGRHRRARRRVRRPRRRRRRCGGERLRHRVQQPPGPEVRRRLAPARPPPPPGGSTTTGPTGKRAAALKKCKKKKSAKARKKCKRAASKLGSTAASGDRLPPRSRKDLAWPSRSATRSWPRCRGRPWRSRSRRWTPANLDRARELCEREKHESQFMHDLLVDGMAGLISFVKEKLGDEGVRDAWEWSLERSWKQTVGKIDAIDRARSPMPWRRPGAATRRGASVPTRERSRSPRTRRSRLHDEPVRLRPEACPQRPLRPEDGWGVTDSAPTSWFPTGARASRSTAPTAPS